MPHLTPVTNQRENCQLLGRDLFSGMLDVLGL
jgi:hypothetical protein